MNLSKSVLIFSIFLLPFLFSCEEDFEVNAPWEEITILYGLLDLQDSVQYIRVQRAYQNTDGVTAQEVAAIKDSIYHTDSLEVRLLSSRGSTYDLIPVARNDKAPGMFSNPDHYLYRTPPGMQLEEDATYRVEVTNLESGHQIHAETPLVQPMRPVNPNDNIGAAINFSTSNVVLSWINGRNAHYYDLEVDIHYTIINREDGSRNQDKINWRIFQLRETTRRPGTEERASVSPESFFDRLKTGIETSPTRSHRIDSLMFHYSSGEFELYNFINVNRPSIGIVQKLPEYTNLSEGYGIFSSRSSTSFKVNLTEITVGDLLTREDLQEYNFVE